MEVLENFKELLKRELQYCYQEYPSGVSGSEDKVELFFKDVENEKDKKIILRELEQNKSYEMEQKELYKTGGLEQEAKNRVESYIKSLSTAGRIAKIIAEKGLPEKIKSIRIVREDWKGENWNSEEGDPGSEIESVEFNFPEVEAEILKAARALAPEYANMSLEEIGKDLREKEAQEKNKKVIMEFKKILNKVPEYNFFKNNFGSSYFKDSVEIVWKNEENTERVSLDNAGNQAGRWNKDESKLIYSADSTAHQLSRLVAERGEPKNIIYTKIIGNNWEERFRGREDCINEEISGVIDFPEVEAEILKAAQALAPEYANMSLEEIGKDLREKEA